MRALFQILIAIAIGIVGVVGLQMLTFWISGGDMSGTTFASVWEAVKEVATKPIYYAQVLGLAGFVGFLMVVGHRHK
ncbi:MAG: hypothetical protein LBN07_01615 [Christensenellaceae bacterium]|jgi:hypothetical protein|nr:hypothetical protein [Christensenellaceae bacterium]